MNLDELFLEVEKDLGPIDDSELDRESLRTPYLFNKYLKFLVTVSIAYKNVEENYNKMRLEKYHYYTGKADPEVYKNEPFDLKVMKTDVHMYLDADDDLSKMRKSLEYSKQRIEYVEKTLKNIQDRNWNIKNAIEWRKFKEGAN
tara:strand:+ start:171 stop:602 length:432 start_codon:yes stop_codon:yes gene_type:complete